MMEVKTIGNKKNVRAYTEFLKKGKYDYNLQISNYTVKITSELINGTFMKNERNNGFFSAFSKIQSDVKKHPVPKIDRSKIKYFEHDFRKDYYAPLVINYDLKNAYATILKNAGYITDKTFDYLGKLPKKDRLASIGMLASKKYIFQYKKGELQHFKKITGKYENFFFYCVKETMLLMKNLKNIAGRDKFLYTWVDSVYLLPDPEKEKEIEEFILNAGLNFTRSELTGFEATQMKGKIKLGYSKDGKETRFYIPPKDSEFAEAISNYITQLKIEQ